MALTKEDLQAIRALMQDEIQQSEQRMNARFDTMQDSIDTLKKDIAHHNHYVEPLLKAVKDGVYGILEHNQKLDRLEDKVDGHDHRIWALEQARKAQ